MEFDECLFGCEDDEESEADGGGKEEREKAADPKYVLKNTTAEVAAEKHHAHTLWSDRYYDIIITSS